MMQPTFSIIIPHKNTPDLLKRCLDSIPQRDDLQVVVVDDNSNPDIVDFDKYPSLGLKGVETYFTKKGGGAGYARNVGLEHAKGKWLLFADADDFFTEELGLFLDEIADTQWDLVYFDYKNVLSDDVTKEVTDRAWYRSYLEDFIEGKTDDKYLRTKMESPTIKLVKRTLVEKHNIRFEEVKWSNDCLFSAKVGVYAETLTVIPKKIYVITQRDGSLTGNYCGTAEEFRVRMGQRYKSAKLFSKLGLGEYCLNPVDLIVKLYNARGPKVFFRYWLANVFHWITFKEMSKFLINKGIRKIGKMTSITAKQ